jgi:hypothetical protein
MYSRERFGQVMEGGIADQVPMPYQHPCAR